MRSAVLHVLLFARSLGHRFGVPGLRRDDWPLKDPKGLPMEEVGAIRDDIRLRVADLLKAEGVSKE